MAAYSQTSATFIGDNYCRRQKFLSAIYRSKHAILVCLARARRMGVADLFNACSDWSTVKKCWPTVQRAVADICRWVRTGGRHKTVILSTIMRSIAYC